VNPGDRLGDFRIVRQLGEGGMGTVYLAHDERLERRVALKVIAPRLADDPEFQRRFETEARSAAAIDDPHAVPIFSAGSEDGRLFIAMRFVDGTDLRTVLSESGALEPAEAVSIIADVASALDSAHAAGFVHRDVKPANILLAERLGKRTAFLTDFGLTKGAQAGNTQLTGTGQWIGTLDYVAPEQMTDGRVDARTDIYALGCVLHEMLTGSVPFPGTEMQKMWAHVNEPLPALDGGGPLEGVLRKATAKDPDERFQSAGELAQAAAEPSSRTRTMKAPPPPAPEPAEQPTAAMATAAPQPTERRSRDGGSSGRVAAAIGGSVILAAGLIGAALVFSGGSETPTQTVVSGAETAAAPVPDSEPTQGEGANATEEDGEAGASSADSTIYSQDLYSVEIPSGWEQEASDEPSGDPVGSFLESVWRDPGEPNTSILIDAQTPAPDASPLESAEQVRAEVSDSPGYREVAFESTTLAGLPAARWISQMDDEEPVDRRVDYFVNACGAGIAILGSTSPALFGSLASTFHEVATSVAVPCGE
jgi:serine/threonine protein kinase